LVERDYCLVLLVAKCLSGFTHFVIVNVPTRESLRGRGWFLHDRPPKANGERVQAGEVVGVLAAPLVPGRAHRAIQQRLALALAIGPTR
jgi:hypothetical protein